MRRAPAFLLLVAVPARAAPPDAWNVTAEAGGEVDSNVERVEIEPNAMDQPTPIAAPVVQFGVRALRRARAFGGVYDFAISDLTRIVDSSAATVENVTLLAGDLRWLHPLGDRPLAAGFGLTAADALPLSDPIGARTFSNLGADAILQMHAGEDHRETVSFGVRKFHYKPVPQYDWLGPVFAARMDFTLWQPASRTKSLELSATAGFESRLFDADAKANTCSPGAPPDPNDCYGQTALLRRDRYERVGLELTWVGRQVAALGYQLIAIESNSFGESVIRNRITASATTTFGDFFVTLLAVLQLDRFLDGVVVQRDPRFAEFTNIEDENRSTLQLRIARKLSGTWSLELRAAAWRNIGGASADFKFERELVYLGAIYSR